jgi:hypothetical protein
MQTFYFTFMTGEGPHPGGCYTTIEAEDFNAARVEMFRRYGRQWAFQYDSAEEAGVEKHELRLIDEPNRMATKEE